MPTRSWTRFDGVDLLRGLAIFFVVMNHINIRLVGADVPYTKGLPKQLVHFLVWNGQLGVQMFFVVSGFLITSISLRRWSPLSRISLRDFYILRFARIAPLLLALLALLSALHFARVPHFIVTEETGGLGRALLAALTFHVNVLEARHGYLPANWDILWSLSVEEMFYLFFPVIARILGRSYWFVALLLTFVVLGPLGRTMWAHGNGIWEDYSYLGGMEGIALGCLTALLVSRIHFSGVIVRALAIVGAAIVSCSLIFSWQGYTDWLGSTGLNMTVLGVGTALFIAATAQTRWRSPRLLSPLLPSVNTAMRSISRICSRCGPSSHYSSESAAIWVSCRCCLWSRSFARERSASLSPASTPSLSIAHSEIVSTKARDGSAPRWSQNRQPQPRSHFWRPSDRGPETAVN